MPEPMDRNLYDLTHDERIAAGVAQLPETLGEAVDEMVEVRVGQQGSR